jgi:prepilin-type N-terminal cleavage/methylation domain-containing protein
VIVRKSRGFTIAEVLTVLMIVGLLLGAMAFAMPVLMRAPLEAQSQVDNVESSALALYRIQRDVRQSHISQIYDCSLPPAVSCTQPQPPPPPAQAPTTPALVVMTADSNAGSFEVSGLGDLGYPKWQGFDVYWLTPNSDGTSSALHRLFFPFTITVDNYGNPTNVTVATAVTVISAALLAPGSETVAQDVQSIRTAIDPVNNIVSLEIDGGDTSGNKSSLSLTSNSYVRN